MERTYKRETGNMIVTGKIIKNLNGAWISAISKGRDVVGGWYVKREMLE